MKNLIFTFIISLLAINVFGQCTPRVLTYTQDFSGSPFANCSPNDGGWIPNSVSSGAAWDVPGTNNAGGTAPEMEAYGNQANGGISETLYLITPPLNTTNVTGLTLSFKHNLLLTNYNSSGSAIIIITVESSRDSVNWNQDYSAAYTATDFLTSVVLETRTIPITGWNADSIYFRFSVRGVLFKLYAWDIDDVNVVADSTTNVPVINDKSGINLFPNPISDNSVLRINSSLSDKIKVEFYNSLGQLILEKESDNPSVPIQKNEFGEAIYF